MRGVHACRVRCAGVGGVAVTHLQGDSGMVAALFVETGGVYFGRPTVDPWDEERDAMEYAGPHAVAAHPPCHLWVNFAALNFKRYGGEHNRPGNDGGKFAKALEAIRQWGGVLEHPAGSNAWARYNLRRPHPAGGWGRNPGSWLWTCEVWQSAYGHKARKRTWLAFVDGLGYGRKPPELNWSQQPGTHQVGWFDRIKPTLSKRQASATPREFADMMLSLAHFSRNLDKNFEISISGAA